MPLRNILTWGLEGASALCRIGLLAVALPAIAAAEDRFPDQLWGADLLLLLEAGPASLDPDLALRIPPPPSAEETRSELDRMELVYLRLQDERTLARISLEAVADPRDLLLSGGLIPDAYAAPALWSLLERASAEATYFALREKRKFSRPRPSMIRPGLRTALPNPPHPAYPSGHASQIHTLAGLLSGLRPGCADAYRLFAAGVSLRREIAGLHFPSDTRAGEALATALLPHLVSHPDLAEPLARARVEMGAFASGTGCTRQAELGE